MTDINENNINYINYAEIDNVFDTFIMHNYMDPDDKGCIRGISFSELCRAIAKKLMEDGAIPMQGD